jgi:hypothetical protein
LDILILSIYLLKNKDELGTLGLYEDENSRGKTKVKLALEIYDLNLQIIYSQSHWH